MTKLLKYTHYVSFELSNICNYSIQHKKCPLNKVEEKIVLPYNLIINVFNFLGNYNFKGMIGFNVYNEPLIDPRLFLLVTKAKEIIGKDAYIYILTNGFFLNQQIINELCEVGVNELMVSAYSQLEFNRMNKYNIPNLLKYTVLYRELDERLNVYDREEINFIKPCNAPLGEIVIACTGEVILCCLDFKKKYVFGDLNKESLEEVLSKDNIVNIRNELVVGERRLEICKRCGYSR